MPDLGLFPLRLVAFPGERLPLHIFEPRYRELIGECVDRSEEFGILLSEESDLRDVGTRMAVVEVLEQFQDGRLNVIVEGRSRFRLVELTEGRSFLTGRVETVVDEDESVDPDASARAIELLQALAVVAGVEIELPDPDAPELSFAIAARVELEVEDEQALLEMRSEQARLAHVAELLAEAAERVRQERLGHESAQTNGKLPHPPQLPG
jgi:Lon protease-like protein